MDLKNMGDVLAEPRIRTLLGEDKWRYLSVLFTDRRGFNLRNDVAHGLLSEEGFNPSVADLVFHGLLTLCTLRKEYGPRNLSRTESE